MQPQNQAQAPSLLDPDTLAQAMASMSGNDQNQNQSTQNILQLYQQAQKAQAVNSQFGPPPAGVSQSDWIDMCEKYAEMTTGNHQTGKFPTASAAENYYAQNGQLNPNVNNAPANSLIYFQPTQGNPAGHVAVADGRGNVSMSNDYGIQTMPLQAWLNESKQQPAGYVVPK